MLYSRIVILLSILALFLPACQREQDEFDKVYWENGDSFPYLTGEDYLMPEPGDVLNFEMINLKDTTASPLFLSWTWKNDTLLKGTECRVLNCPTSDTDILLPENLYFYTEGSLVARYVQGYRYTLFDAYLATTPHDSVFRTFGIGNHHLVYSFNSPLEKADIAGYSRKQISAGIDSFAVFGDEGKHVKISFTHQFGITEVRMSRILYLGNQSDTLQDFVLKRIL